MLHSRHSGDFFQSGVRCAGYVFAVSDLPSVHGGEECGLRSHEDGGYASRCGGRWRTFGAGVALASSQSVASDVFRQVFVVYDAGFELQSGECGCHFPQEFLCADDAYHGIRP